MTKLADPIAQIWSFGEDPFDDALTLHFAICELMWAEGGGIPGEWRFVASPLHARHEGAQTILARDSWPDTELAEAWLEKRLAHQDLLYAGRVFFRYLTMLKSLGVGADA